MRVLSLFDWIACGYEALVRAWIKIDAYYASEIDKYAIQIALKNHPDIIELGDVNDFGDRPIEPDMIIGGSPCQWFSIAGKMLNFEDPRSKLFFKFVQAVKWFKPKYFLLENVKMKKEWQDIISRELWVEPIEINSSLVSAQNRKRLYRTNIPNVSQPKDKGIMLKDILQENVDEKYNCSERQIEVALWWKHQQDNLQSIDGKARTLVAWTHWNAAHYTKVIIPKEWENLISVVDDEIRIKQATKQWYIVAHEWDGIDLNYPKSNTRRWRVIHQKSNTLTTWWEAHVYNKVIRKLTPIECERLQTLPDNYTEWVSDTQRYKMLWNWWTVDVIAHIFSFIK